MKNNSYSKEFYIIFIILILFLTPGCNDGNTEITGRIILSDAQTGLSGIEIELRYETGVAIDTAVTQPCGTYSFTLSQNGSYFVIPVSRPYSYLPAQIFIEQPIRRQRLSDILARPVEGTLIPMRDGVELATDIYLPPDHHQERYPTILLRTPYGKDDSGLVSTAKAWAEKENVAVVVQDTRGQGQSKGNDRIFQTDGWGELQDGSDTFDWIISQRWSNGRIATHGGSAIGMTANLLDGAVTNTGYMFKILIASPLSLYESFFYSPGGVFKKNISENWLAWQSVPRYGVKGYQDILNEVKRNYKKDVYWDNVDLSARKEFLNVPTYHLGGWFDVFMPGIIDSYHAHVEAGKAEQNIIIGPWTHSAVRKQEQNELIFPENALMYPEAGGGDPAWSNFLAQLKDRPYTVPYPAVTYYVIGDCFNPDTEGNEWRHSTRFPPPEATPLNLFFDGLGILSPDHTDGSVMNYTFNTETPVPTKCGQNLIINPGPCDISDYSLRDDLLFFSTEPFSSPTEITGAVSLRLKAKVDQIDTDFVAFLVDIYPDNKHYLMIEGSQKARFRHELREEVFINSDEWFTIDISLGYISLMLNKGHRLGLYISNTNYPKYNLPSGTENYWDDSFYQAQVDIDLSHSILTVDLIGSWNGR